MKPEDDFDALPDAPKADDFDSLPDAPPPHEGAGEKLLRYANKAVTPLANAANKAYEDPVGSVRSGLSGATYGAAPAIVDAIEGVLPAEKMPLWGNEQTGETNRDTYKKAVKNHPIENIAGAAVAPNPFGPIGNLGKNLRGVGGLVANTGFRAAEGFGQGKLADIGASEHPLDEALSYGNALGPNAKISTAIGAGGGAAGQLIRSLVPLLRKSAARSAASSLAMPPGRMNALGLGAPGESQRIGKELLGPEYSAFATAPKIREQAAAIQNELGPKYSDITKRFDELTVPQAPGVGGQTANMRPVKAELDLDAIANAARSGLPAKMTAPEVRSSGPAMQHIQDILEERGGAGMQHRLTTKARTGVSLKDEAEDADKMLMDVINAGKHKPGGLYEQLAKALGGNVGQELKQIGPAYGNAANIEKLAKMTTPPNAVMTGIPKQLLSGGGYYAGLPLGKLQNAGAKLASGTGNVVDSALPMSERIATPLRSLIQQWIAENQGREK